jgi:hypothetical protein
VSVYFSLGPGEEFPVSDLQGKEGPVLTWLPLVHPNTILYAFAYIAKVDFRHK